MSSGTKMKKLVIAIILSFLISLPVFTNTATAITGNLNPDSKPYVGIIVLYDSQQQPIGYCSGFLISPTIMVTAGHSLLNAQSVKVSFDKGPITENSNFYEGTPETYSSYIPTLSGNSEFQTSDIGLIILNEPITDDIQFPELPPIGFTETLKHKTDLEVFGYGMQYQTTPRNNGVTNSWMGQVTQNSATVELLNANFAGIDKYLKLTANNAQGKGAVAFGDSGGPVIYTDATGNDIVLALNAFVSSANCNGVSYHTRIDTNEVLNWIDEYLD